MGCCSSKRNKTQNSKKSCARQNKMQFHSEKHLTNYQNLPTSADNNEINPIAVDFEGSKIFQKIPTPTSYQDQIKIEKILLSHPIFYYTNSQKITKLSKKFIDFTYSNQTKIFNSETENLFFIIAEGSIEVSLRHSQKLILTSGMCFYKETFSEAEFKTLTVARCWVIKFNDFLKESLIQSRESCDQLKNFINKYFDLGEFQTEVDGILISCCKIIKLRYNDLLLQSETRGNIYGVITGKIVFRQSQFNSHVVDTCEIFSDYDLKDYYDGKISILPREEAELISIDLSSFKNFDQNLLRRLKYSNSIKKCFKINKKFSKLSKVEIEKFLQASNIQTLETNEIFKVDQNHILILLEGNLYLSKQSIIQYEIIKIKKTFKHEKTFIKSTQQSVFLIISDSAINSILGASLKTILKRNKLVSFLKKVSTLKYHPKEVLVSISENLDIVKYGYNQVIFTESSQHEKFYIVLYGQVILKSSQNKTKIISSYESFEEIYLTNNHVSITSAISLGCKLMIIDKRQLELLKSKSIANSELLGYEKKENSIDLNELYLIKLIGKGTYGNVFLSYCKKMQKFYAVKSVNKKKVEKF